MDIIPLVQIKKRKILIKRVENNLSDSEFLEKSVKGKNLYVLDYDGIENNRPNLCLYKTLSNSYALWVDMGPRVIGDVVDTIMAGATDITVRKNIWVNTDISSIKDISDNKIYTNISLDNYDKFNNESFSLYDRNDLVVFDRKTHVERDFKYSSFLKNLCIKNNLYAYEEFAKNISYWNNLGFAGLLVDINNIEEF